MIADSFQTSFHSHRSSFAIAARWSRDVQAKSAGRFQMRPGATPRGGDGGVCDVEVGRGCRGKCFLRAPWKRQGTGEWVRDPSAMPLSQSLSQARSRSSRADDVWMGGVTGVVLSGRGWRFWSGGRAFGVVFEWASSRHGRGVNKAGSGTAAATIM